MARLGNGHGGSLGREQALELYGWFAAQKITPVEKPGTDPVSQPASDAPAFPVADPAAAGSLDAVEDAILKQE